MGQMSDHILVTSFEIYRRILDRRPKKAGDAFVDGKQCKNPDNWLHGSLGGLFFTAELYRQTSDRAVWYGLVNRLDELEKQVHAAPSSNYSLCFGRTGLAYFYTRLFEISGQREFTERALTLIQRCFEPAWWAPVFEKSSLAEGTSGFLFFCLAFYRVTGERAMPGVIERLLGALMSQAHLSDSGVFWQGNGPDERCCSGLAYGGSGIALALLQAGSLTGNGQLLDIGRLALKFDCSCIAGQMVSVPQLGFYHGEAGKQLIRLYYERLTVPMGKCRQWTAMVRTMSRLLTDQDAGNGPLGLSNGLAGWGIALLEGALVTMDQQNRDLVDRVGQLLLYRLDKQMNRYQDDISYSTGLSGIGYFLLRWNSPDLPGHSPFSLIGDPDGVPAAISNPGLATATAYYDELLLKSMPGTLRLLRELYPTAIASLPAASPVLPGALIGKSRELAAGSPAAGREKELLSTAEKEYFDTQMHNWAITAAYSGEEEFKSGVTALFATSGKEFMNLRLKVSDHIKIADLDDRREFRVDGKFTPADIQYLVTSYGVNTICYTMGRYGSVDSQTLGIGKLFCFLFTEEKPVRDAIRQLVSLVDRQEKEIAGLLATVLGGANASDLKRILKNRMIKHTRLLLMTGILCVH